MTLVWSRRVIKESLGTWRSCQELENPVETNFSQNSRPYIVLKPTHNLHIMLVFHWSWPTPMHFFLWSRLTFMQCLFFIGHGLHSCISCFLVITFLISSMAGCICQQHLLGSSQVKVIYYTNSMTVLILFLEPVQSCATWLAELHLKQHFSLPCLQEKFAPFPPT